MTPITPLVKTMGLLLSRSHLYGENNGPRYEHKLTMWRVEKMKQTIFLETSCAY